VRIGKTTVWDSLDHGHRDLLTPNLPNVFLAVVPAARAAELGALVEKAIWAEWKTIADKVWAFCDGAAGGTDRINLTADEGAISRAKREERFRAQTERFLTIAWQTTPWPETLDATLALAGGFAPDMPSQQARKRVEAVMQMATVQMPVDHRDGRYYIDSGKTSLNNIGLAWAVIAAVNSWQLDAVRQTCSFDAWNEGGWSAGAENNKDALNGRDEAVAGGKTWSDRCGKLTGVWPGLFKKGDWMGAVTLIKRLWHLAYLRDVWGLPTESRGNKREGFPMPSTRGIAAHQLYADDDQLDPDEGGGDRYFAVLALDGDKIGKWVSGEKTPRFATQLADYSDAGGEQRFGSRVYFERPEFARFRSAQRPLSPSYHLQFSEALSNFALLCARPIVEHFDGRLIYAGGDDVLALLPADTALACARSLRLAFRGEDPDVVGFASPAPGFLQSDHWREQTGKQQREHERPIPFLMPGPATDVSVGLAIAHFKAPLQDVIREARAAERRAKTVLQREAIAVTLIKHGGEINHWGCKWASGGLELFAKVLELLTGRLSAKFPHRVAELLQPYLIRQSGLYEMQGATGFDAGAVIRREVAFAADRQSTERGAAKRDTQEDVDRALGAYLDFLGGDDRDIPFRAVIGLCETVAFAHRTRLGSDSVPRMP